MPFQPGNKAAVGNGRPRRADKHAGKIAAAEKRIADRLPELIDAQFALALGVTVQEVDEETGGVEIYTTPPSHQAGAYLINRIMGKPTERHEHQIEDMSQLTDAELEAIISGKSRG